MVDRRRTGGLLVELFIVMVGVLVALAFDEWREEQQRAEVLNNVLVAMVEETERNLAAVREVRAYHEEMRDVFNDYANRFEETREWAFPDEEFEGMRLAELSDAAYQSGLMTGLLPRLEFGTLQEISRAYARVESYNRDNERFALATLQTDFKDASRYLRILNFHFASLNDSETRLIPAFEALSEQLDAALEARH